MNRSFHFWRPAAIRGETFSLEVAAEDDAPAGADTPAAPASATAKTIRQRTDYAAIHQHGQLRKRTTIDSMKLS
jgi:hypothetical protein